MTLTPREEAVLKLIEEDSAYEDYFFKKVTDVKWFDPLKKKEYFSPKKAPALKPADQEGYFVIPEWNVLPYLERVSQQINMPGNEKYIDELLAIIKDVSNYKDAKGQHIDNYRTWYYFVKILLNIPNDKIPSDIIDLTPIWLDSKFNITVPGSEIATKLLPKFLPDSPTSEDIQKAEKIIKSITTIKSAPLSKERAELLDKKEEARLVIGSYWLIETFKKHPEIIGKKCTTKLIEDLAKKIRTLLKDEKDGTYESFHEELEYATEEPLVILTFILKRILLAKAKSDVNTAKGILRDFFNDERLYFPKMAIYIIGQNIDYYSDLFWEILDTEIGDLILEKTLYLGDELKYLLKNLTDLSDEQRIKLNTKIEQASERHIPEENPEKYIALYKQEIYQALIHDSYFKNLYEKMKSISNIDAELRPIIGKVETLRGPGSSPFTKEEILKMPNDELANHLLTFKTKDSWRGPSVGGFAKLLAEVAREMPEKFIENPNTFKDTGFIYIYEILRGIKDAWNGKKIIDWNKVFQFIELYIDRKEFWEDKFIVEKGDWLGEADHEWVAGIVAELIQDGTRDDSWAFPEKHFDKAEKIIFLILDNLKTEEDKEITDYVTYTLNTVMGKAITALILFALRIARVNDKKGSKNVIKWTPEYKGKYDKILSKKIIEGFTCLGSYIPNFFYLDIEWGKEKIRHLENEKGSKHWEAFMDGYLSTGKVYDDLYDLMKPHCQYGFAYDFKEQRNNKHLIQHICIGYLRDHEKLDDSDSLFRKIIDAWTPDQIKEIIGFFWMQRDYLIESSDENEKIITKIIEFWKRLHEKYKGKDENSLTQEDKQILSSASKLTVFLQQIDTESYEWLMLSAPYVDEDFYSSFFIEYLDELKNKGDSKETAKYIGKIYLRMLDKITPTYDKKHIRSIVEFLYKSNAEESASKICDIYGREGYEELLKDIYEKYSRR